MGNFKTDRNAISIGSFWKILSPMESSDSQQKFGASLVLRGVVKVDFRTTWNLKVDNVLLHNGKAVICDLGGVIMFTSPENLSGRVQKYDFRSTR